MDRMYVRPRAALLLAAFLALWGFLTAQPGRWADWSVHALLGLVLAVASVNAIVRLVRGHPPATDPAAGLPRPIRRWLYGE